MTHPKADSRGKDQPRRRKGGFEPASALLDAPLRAAGKARGFSAARLFTHWTDVVGADLAALARPVRVGRSRTGIGATLTLAVEGATGPMVEMQKERIRDRVNASYGYNAISRIAFTQGGCLGMAETAAPFAHAPPSDRPAPPDAASRRLAEQAASGVSDDGLRAALERLGERILSRHATPTKAGPTKMRTTA